MGYKLFDEGGTNVYIDGEEYIDKELQLKNINTWEYKDLDFFTRLLSDNGSKISNYNNTILYWSNARLYGWDGTRHYYVQDDNQKIGNSPGIIFNDKYYTFHMNTSMATIINLKTWQYVGGYHQSFFPADCTPVRVLGVVHNSLLYLFTPEGNFIVNNDNQITLINQNTILPTTSFSQYQLISFNNQIHGFFDYTHYIFNEDSSQWEQQNNQIVNENPSALYCVIYNNTLLLFGHGLDYYYKYNTELSCWDKIDDAYGQSSYDITITDIEAMVFNNTLIVMYQVNDTVKYITRLNSSKTKYLKL